MITCDGRLDKLDTVTDRKLQTKQLIAIPKSGADECLARDTVFDSKTSVFRIATPSGALAFSVPQLKPVKSEIAGTGALEGADVSPPNEILESSGDYVLLRIFTAEPGNLKVAVENRKTKTLVDLKNLPPTAAPKVHLAPGGRAAVIEEISGPGKLAVYNTQSGSRIKEVSDPRVEGMYFLAIAPNGKVIYHKGIEYRFVSLGRAFDNQLVMRHSNSDYPGLFFSGS